MPQAFYAAPDLAPGSPIHQTVNLSIFFNYAVKSGCHSCKRRKYCLKYVLYLPTKYFDQHKRFIIERTLTHGTLSDWFLIKKYYGKATIKAESMQIRYLDKQTLAFCAAYFFEPIQNFRCHTLKQSDPSHWDY